MDNVVIRPPCRLPTVFTPSYLIGNTVNALSRAGLSERAREFTEELDKKAAFSDYHQVLAIAHRYVDFL